MMTAERLALKDDTMLSDAIEAACDSIAPTWPLDRFIAVNPYWGRTQQPFERVHRTMACLASSRLFMPLAFYREAWQRDEIRREHLRLARADLLPSVDEEGLIDALHREEALPPAFPVLSDVIDSRRDLTHEPTWRDTIIQQITQFCAAYFDYDQADWHPDRSEGMYASWRRMMATDHHVSLLMHAPEIRRRVHNLPDDRDAAFTWTLEKLGVSPEQVPNLLQVLLLRVNGWASWCAYLRWQARLAHQDDFHLVDLLAIRLAWEYLVDDDRRAPESAWAHWRHAWSKVSHEEGSEFAEILATWQRALEFAYQLPLAADLCAPRPEFSEPPAIQAAFCIDVRSEVMRRALESADPGVQTLGVAGNFGLPIQYAPIGTDVGWPQLPGLLAPKLRVTESCGVPDQDRALAGARRAKLADKESWQPFYRLPGSAFTLVEAMGLKYLGKILRRSLPQLKTPSPLNRLGLEPSAAMQVRPQLLIPEEDLATRADLAEGILKTMGLAHGLAPLVLLVGHGSQTTNNPHAAGLDCGACGGQSGDVNARALAALLNDPRVREALRDRAIAIPESTHFLPALHNTTTDEVTVFDRDHVPPQAREDLARIERGLLLAGERVRAERAPSLGLAHLVSRPQALAKALKARANDWAETRPEWGLVNNASFIVASRARSRGLNLRGRAFLHEYDFRHDPAGTVLAQIMSGPMIVTHWINMQYYASTVDNLNYGSGNKVLQNVVGGRLGVFEGNGGDMRIGLSLQSVHDGQRWRHTPLRLSVFVDAPKEAIEKVLATHEPLRTLLENRWLFLFRLEDRAVEAYRDGQWQAWSDMTPTRHA